MTSVPTARLGGTGYDITRVGLGAWAIGGGDWQGGWGPQDDAESISTIHAALDRGINWIDTAPAYGLGHAEEVVGRALKEIGGRRRPLLFTKCGLVWKEGERSVSNVLAPDSIRRECEASLRRLGVEVIDLLQIHWPTQDGTPIEESWATMRALVDEGTVRAIGVSNFSLDLLDSCEAIRHVDTVQPQLNLINRDALDDVIPWAVQHASGVLAYSPMASGLLSGGFTLERAASLPEDDWRRSDANFTEPRLSRNLELAATIAAIARRHGCSAGDVAVAWVLSREGVSAAIVGARRPDQIDGWINGASLALPEEDLEELMDVAARTGVADPSPTR